MMKHLKSTTLFALLFAIFLIGGCGDSPPDLPAPVLDYGTLVISGKAITSPTEEMAPQQIGVIINGDDYGLLENPATIGQLRSGNYRVESYFVIDGIRINLGMENIEVVFNESATSSFDVQTGQLIVTGQIEASPGNVVEPDSIGINLDGDDLGYFDNPFTFGMLPIGDHTISTYCTYDDKDFLGPSRTTTISFGESTESTFDLLAGGVLSVSATYDGASVGDIGITVDGDSIDVSAAPLTVANIEAGLHKLTAWATEGEDNLGGWVHDVSIALGETTYVDLEMTKVSPYLDEHIPDFACVDIDGNSHVLSDHFGEVIYLYFFSYT